MKRRNFLKSSALLGTAAIGAGVITATESCSSGKVSDRPKYITPPADIIILQELENDFMKIKIFSNGVIEAMDKKNNQTWKTFTASMQDETVIDEGKQWSRSDRAMGEQYPGRFIGKKDGDNIRFTLLGRLNLYVGSFLCKFALEKDWMSFQLLEVDESLPSLVFPPPFESEALVLPIDGGKIYKNNSVNIFQRKYLQFFSSLGMRFFAGLNGENGWICAFDLKTADAGAMLVNGQITPAWVRTMGKWQGGHYIVKYSFTNNNYVGIAKKYRQYAMDNGFFKSLKEKIETNPEVSKMVGGRALQFMNLYDKGYEETKDDYLITEKQFETMQKVNLNFTFPEVIKKVKLAEEKLGFKKGMVLLRGWMHGGMDSAHPEIWPPDPKLGSIDKLKEIMDLRNKYITALHDNYQDYYPTAPSFPKGVIVRKDGTYMSGGLWANGHQCYMTNSRDSVKYAKQNWEQVKQLQPTGYFIDTTTCNALYESYEKGNEQTRVQDMQYKFELLKMFSDQKILMGSENFGDHFIPVIHWLEHRQKRVEGETIPLWQLVFHDAAFTSRYDVFEEGSPYPSWIEDMFYGNFLRFWIPREFGEGKTYKTDSTAGWGKWHFTDEEFKNSYHVDEWHAKIALEEMTSHKFLTDDFKVEEVVYGDKYKMTVNFDSKERVVNGKKIKAYGYVLES